MISSAKPSFKDLPGILWAYRAHFSREFAPHAALRERIDAVLCHLHASAAPSTFYLGPNITRISCPDIAKSRQVRDRLAIFIRRIYRFWSQASIAEARDDAPCGIPGFNMTAKVCVTLLLDRACRCAHICHILCQSPCWVLSLRLADPLCWACRERVAD